MSFSSKPPAGKEQTSAEKQAILRLKAGEIEGLETLVQLYQVSAVHAAILIVHDRILAEEIAQNSFLHAYHKIQQFDENRPFAPWFLRSVINAALQEAKRQKRLVSLEEAIDEEADVPAWLIDPALCPPDLAESEALYQELWQALSQLSPNQRAAVVMRYLLGSSEAEITQKLQRPLTTIKWWLYAARKRLRRILQDGRPAEEDQEKPNE